MVKVELFSNIIKLRAHGNRDLESSRYQVSFWPLTDGHDYIFLKLFLSLN